MNFYCENIIFWVKRIPLQRIVKEAENLRNSSEITLNYYYFTDWIFRVIYYSSNFR
jgi:hypothetical protein